MNSSKTYKKGDYVYFTLDAGPQYTQDARGCLARVYDVDPTDPLQPVTVRLLCPCLHVCGAVENLGQDADDHDGLLVIWAYDYELKDIPHV